MVSTLFVFNTQLNGQRPDKALPEISNALISFEGETGIPESWPLYSHRLQSTALRPASGEQNFALALLSIV